MPADGDTGHGVRLRMANFFFDKPIECNEEEYDKMLEIEAEKVGILSIIFLKIFTNSHVDSWL